MENKFDSIKNIVLLGHAGSGKTSFVETMLFESGMTKKVGNISTKNTISDYTNIEKEKEHSIFCTTQHLFWKDSKINILDTPGMDDFVGETIAGIAVADTAVMVVSADNGVEVGTELAWDLVSERRIPSVFAINKMDHPKANFNTSLQSIKDHFGSRVLQFQYPLNEGFSFSKIIDALRMVMYVFPENGGKPSKEPIPESEMKKAQELHNLIVEAAAENDEGLMEQFFEAGTLTEEELTKGLSIALSNHQIFPVFVCSSSMNKGTGRIMGFLHDIAPMPEEYDQSKNSEHSKIFIYRTFSEPQVGKVSYFKVLSGTLKSGSEMYNLNNRSEERLNQIFSVNGKNRKGENELVAGDLGAMIKKKNAHTNETLSTDKNGTVEEPIAFPESRVRNAIRVEQKGDYDKVLTALYQTAHEDLTLKVEPSKELGQTIVHGQGKMHLDLIKYRIEKVNNLNFDWIRPKIPFRESITVPAESSYRHKKQSGGSGQFGEVKIKVEPYVEGSISHNLHVKHHELIELPWGGVLSFNWCIVGGTIDAKYQGAIKKGLIEQMSKGNLVGYPVINVTVSVIEGKMHSVDSNDAAFSSAAKGALKQAFESCNPIVLEPMYEVHVKGSSESIGDIMSDLQTRRAIIEGMGTQNDKQIINAVVPYLEMHNYSSNLRSLSHGKAKFRRKFKAYQRVDSGTMEKIRQFINHYED